jgi:host factor-I protein
MPSPIFISLLESSRLEQQQISIYITHATLQGVVSNLYPEAVELRMHDGKRCVIDVEKIEAIITL